MKFKVNNGIYIIGIVGVVALVGILTLLMHGSATSNDLSGLAVVPITSGLPDLTLNPVNTTVSLNGTIYFLPIARRIASSSVTANLTIGVKNYGAADATGNSYSSGSLYYDMQDLGVTAYSRGAINLGVGSTFLMTGKSNLYTTSKSYNATKLLTELLVNHTANLSINYTLDRYYSKYGINESDETNNNGTYSLMVLSSGITFIPVQCWVDSDCPSGCGCGNITTANYTCVNSTTTTSTTTSGSSTYTTTRTTYSNTTCGS